MSGAVFDTVVGAVARHPLACELTLRQLHVLLLADMLLEKSVKDFAAAAALPKPSVTRSLDRLAAAKLVSRSADPADRRRVCVRLTPAGRGLLAELRAAA